jgi:translation initiation factor eIF-2B subunit epsilon
MIDQGSIVSTLGKDSNAFAWPPGPDDDDDINAVENFNNRRLMAIGGLFLFHFIDAYSILVGDDVEDLNLPGPVSTTFSESESESSEESDDDREQSRSAAAESEFRREVSQSLERAFSEGHSVDNAAVELKTLRMATNVPLSRVREAVVGAIVERIQIVDGGVERQQKEIATVIDRWGELIDKIGGINSVETVTALQVLHFLHVALRCIRLTCAFVFQSSCASSTRLPLFGRILFALYQNDVVEEEDIREWHATPSSKGVGLKPGPFSDNIRRCWEVGGRMIQQFNEQESDESE